MADRATPREIAIDVQGVTYTHWNQTQPTLKNVSLQIRRRELTILVGPGGAGKSTLCDLFNGIIPHLSGGVFDGNVFVDGVNTRSAKVRDLARHVGRVFQDPETMFATLYVDDEIAFGPENMCHSPEAIRQDVARLLAEGDLTRQSHHLVWQLSGGQVQKLGLACVLAMHPETVILDEPTSNLDPVATHSLHQEILALRDRGITVVLVTRELDEFLAEADQLVVLSDGEITAAGPPRDVLRQHGEYLMNQLGIWLPETTEISIGLRARGQLTEAEVPITLDDMLAALKRAGLHNLAGERPARPALPENHRGPRELLISARNLRFTYPGGLQALKDVSLDVRAGEMLAIIGRNGAGKSTLSQMMVGLIRPHSGELTLFGKPARRWRVQDLANHIALVFQNPEHQFLTDSVSEEIGYSLLARGISEPKTVEQVTRDTLHRLDLQDVVSSHPLALSAGKKRRLGVATMLVGEPQVLIVDEPTYGQDRQMTATLMALMETIRARGIAVVMVTHDMRLVQEFAERVVVMNLGQVIFDGAPEKLFLEDDLLEQASLRPTLLHRLVGRLRQAGVAVGDEIRHTRDLLELLTPIWASEA